MKSNLLLRLAPLLLLVTFCAGLVGCGSGESVAARSEEPSPEEKQFLTAARPFLEAIVARDYNAAFAWLSLGARAKMSLNQFVPAQDDATFERNERRALSNVQTNDFVAWMKKVEQEHGMPAAILDAHVFSTDRAVLEGKGNRLEVMFAIGGMPKSLPGETRRASLRCQIATRLTDAQLKKVASETGISVAQLKKDPDFKPSFNLKLVLVEEQNVLKIGYFEFMPPSMLD